MLVQDDLSALTSQIRRLERRTRELAALQADERDAVARIERLEHILDVDRIAAHVRGAIAKASLTEQPLPHMWIADVLPPAAYQAVIDAIPPDLFFERDR